MHLSRFSAALGAAVLALMLAGCGDDTSSGSDASEAPGASSSVSTEMSMPIEAGSLTMTDPWVKAAKTGMTAAFGTLVNNGDEDITVVSATSDITTAMELHETVQNDDGTMAMQPKDGGFVIPAGGEHELAPGGDHLMIMDLTRPLDPGESIIIELEFADGSTTEIDATVKRFHGADEKYQHGDMDDMEMSDDMDSDSGDM